MHSYKGGNLDAKDMTDQDAATYADEHNISNDASADAQVLGESSAAALNDEDAEGEPEKEPTPPPKTPKGKARKGKATKNTPATSTPAAPETIVPPASSSSSIVPAKPVEKPSPEKKRKRASKKADEPAEKEEMAVETPKSVAKPRKKKAKSDA
jgi:hypothetical protein